MSPNLPQCPLEAAEHDQRKLHEVCINHRLANHLEHFLFPLLADNKNFAVDIEFNREGGNKKEIFVSNNNETVRPDIIIHNRRSGDKKVNILVVECKKKPVSDSFKDFDKSKIEAFLRNSKYCYQYGLQVFYSDTGVEGIFYYLDNEKLKEKPIN